MKPVGVGSFAQDLSDTIQTIIDRYKCVLQKKNEEIVDSKHEVEVHNDEPQVVEEKYKVEVQEIEDNVIDENTNVEYVDVTCDEFSEEQVMSLEECSIAVLVYVRLPDKVLAIVQSEIQPIFIYTSVHDFMMIPEIVLSKFMFSKKSPMIRHLLDG